MAQRELPDGPRMQGAENVEVQGATLTVETQGVGPRIFVLIHGIGMGRSVFAGLVEYLNTEGQIIAIDQPGYGETPEPARTPTMERTADLIAEVLTRRDVRASGREIVVVGHSMGSQVATELAVRHPHLVDRLVLMAPTVDAAARNAWKQLARLGRDLIAENPRVLFIGAREYLRAGPNLRRKMKAMLRHRPEDAYPRITAPTMVLRGGDDAVCPREWCERVTSLIPNAVLTELEGHRHETMIKNPEAAAKRLLAFV